MDRSRSVYEKSPIVGLAPLGRHLTLEDFWVLNGVRRRPAGLTFEPTANDPYEPSFTQRREAAEPVQDAA